MSAKSPLTTHVLDIAAGRPARGIRVTLERERGGAFTEVASGITNDDGRVADLLASDALEAGTYRMTFHVADYFAASGVRGFYPHVPVVFTVERPSEHHHVPLLLSPFGYSTYRGS